MNNIRDLSTVLFLFTSIMYYIQITPVNEFWFWLWNKVWQESGLILGDHHQKRPCQTRNLRKQPLVVGQKWDLWQESDKSRGKTLERATWCSAGESSAVAFYFVPSLRAHQHFRGSAVFPPDWWNYNSPLFSCILLRLRINDSTI